MPGRTRKSHPVAKPGWHGFHEPDSKYLDRLRIPEGHVAVELDPRRYPFVAGGRPPEPLKTYEKLPDGERKWNQAWTEYLDREYTLKSAYPDIIHSLKVFTDMYNPGFPTPEFLSIVKDQMDTLRGTQMIFLDFLRSYNQPKDEEVGMNIFRRFEWGWLGLPEKEREDAILRAILQVVRNGEDIYGSPGERMRQGCPETSTTWLQKKGGRPVIDLITAIFGPPDNLNSIGSDPVLITHPVFTHIYGVGYKRAAEFQKYAAAYHSDALQQRTEVITNFLLILVRNHFNLVTILSSVKFGHVKESVANMQGMTPKVMKKANRAWNKCVWFCSHPFCPDRESEEEPTLQCVRCKGINRKVLYCSKTCQRADWKTHKVDCGKPLAPPTSVTVVDPVGPEARPMREIPPPEAGFLRSPALEKQLDLLRNANEKVVYFIFVKTSDAGHLTMPITSPNYDLSEQDFMWEYFSEVAFRNGNPVAVGYMCYLIDRILTGFSPMGDVLSTQLSEEFGIEVQEINLWRDVLRSDQEGIKVINAYFSDVEARQTVD